MGQSEKGSSGENWLQGLIASALMMGISKRELLEDYYLDEILEIMKEWNRLHGAESSEPEPLDALAFFGDGGEIIG